MPKNLLPIALSWLKFLFLWNPTKLGAILIFAGLSIIIPGISELWVILVRVIYALTNKIIIKWIGSEPLPIPETAAPWIGLVVIALGCILVILASITAIVDKKDVFVISKTQKPDGSMTVNAFVIADTEKNQKLLEKNLQISLDNATKQNRETRHDQAEE